jgi:hypothetical protein
LFWESQVKNKKLFSSWFRKFDRRDVEKGGPLPAGVSQIGVFRSIWECKGRAKKGRLSSPAAKIVGAAGRAGG